MAGKITFWEDERGYGGMLMPDGRVHVPGVDYHDKLEALQYYLAQCIDFRAGDQNHPWAYGRFPTILQLDSAGDVVYGGSSIAGMKVYTQQVKWRVIPFEEWWEIQLTMPVPVWRTHDWRTGKRRQLTYITRTSMPVPVTRSLRCRKPYTL